MVRVKVLSQYVYVMGIYRPPQSSLAESMDVIASALDTVPTWKHTIILIGDINIDCLNHNPGQILLTETLLSYNMTRLPLPATRTTPRSQTSIDCVCTNLNEEEVAIKIRSSGISDHTAQLCTLNSLIEETENVKVHKRNFNDDNIRRLQQILSLETWERVVCCNDVETAYKSFYNIIMAAINQTCPYKKCSLRKTKENPWDPELYFLRREFLNANDLYLLTGSLEHKQMATDKKKQYDLKIKERRRKSVADQIARSENKTKAIWNIIGTERRAKRLATGPKELRVDNKISCDPQKIVDYLNHTFTTMADIAILHNNPTGNNTKCPLQLYDTPPFISVRQHLKKLSIPSTRFHLKSLQGLTKSRQSY